MFRTALITICLICSAVSAQAPVDHELSIVPDARFLPEVERFSGIALTINRDMVTDILVDDEIQIKNFPLSRVRSVDLALKRFDVFTTDAEVVVASINSHGQIVEISTTRPDVVLLRGFIIDEPESQVFLALGVHTTNGWIESRGSTFVVAKNPKENWTAVYELDAVDPSLMNWVDFKCGVQEATDFMKAPSSNRTDPRGSGINCGFKTGGGGGGIAGPPTGLEILLRLWDSRTFADSEDGLLPTETERPLASDTDPD